VWRWLFETIWTDRFRPKTQIRKSTVTAISKTLSKVVSAESSEVGALKTIALFCGVGLLVSLLLIAGVAGLPLELTPDVMEWM
jgi:hypothetical protein